MRHPIIRSVVIVCSVMLSPCLFAASPDFQDFLSRACNRANATSDFFTRCNVDSVNGDLSGDSEDSLNPTQSLANGANAIAETRARIKALQEKVADAGTAVGEDSDVKKTFGESGFSLLVNGEDGGIEREFTTLERGYETDSNRVQLGFDYRIDDNWIVGVVGGVERYDTTYAADQPGTNFIPEPSDGDSERDSVTISIFTASTFGTGGYFDAIVSYSQSDFTFRRIAVFQETTRTLPTRTITTSAETEGDELALSIGVSWDKNWDATTLQWYGRMNHQRSSIDPYSESGGSGFAMRIRSEDVDETVATLGLKLSRSVNESYGILVPQAYVEYEGAFNADPRTSISSFLSDATREEFAVIGDEPDGSYGRVGVSLLAGFPNGFSCFVGVTKTFGQDFIDEFRFNAGLRAEF